MNEVMGDMVNIIGDGNDVTINDIKEILEDYQNLKIQNDSLLSQNTKYFEDLTDANENVEELQKQAGEIPTLNFTNLAMCIDGNDIPVNQNNSMVTVDGHDYISKEFFEKLVPDNQNITFKDNTLYIGRVIAEKKSLFSEAVMDKSNFDIIDTISDSYGNNYANVLCCHTGNTGKKYIMYVLNNKYSLLKISLSIRDDANLDDKGIITIKADDDIVYTSESLNKTTEPFVKSDIPINNCTILTITYDCGIDYIDCIISDAVIYN